MLNLREYLLQVVQPGSQPKVSLLKCRSTTIGADSPRELGRRCLLDVRSFPGVSLYAPLRYLEVVDIFSLTLACSIMMLIMTAAVRGSRHTSTPPIM